MITRVKVLLGGHAHEGGDPINRFPGYSFIYDATCTDYDWLVIYDEIPEDGVGTVRDGHETAYCPKSHTILCTSEPVSIKHYSRAFTRQFGHLLTNRPQTAERHPHYHFGQGYYESRTGRTREGDFDAVIPPKTKLISTVCSSKQMRHTSHFARYQLTRDIAAAVPGLDWYGYGVRPLKRKADVLDEYRYYLAIENHIAAGHWTEKLSDAFLCECLPFYAGDPAIADVFPERSIIPIPLYDREEAVRIVRTAIANGEYEKRREAVLEAKRLILEKYNFWSQVIKVIESTDKEESRTWSPYPIWDRKVLRKRNVGAMLEDGWFHFRQYTGASL